jgi:hypothetical protein
LGRHSGRGDPRKLTGRQSDVRESFPGLTVPTCRMRGEQSTLAHYAGTGQGGNASAAADTVYSREGHQRRARLRAQGRNVRKSQLRSARNRVANVVFWSSIATNVRETRAKHFTLARGQTAADLQHRVAPTAIAYTPISRSLN